MRSSSAIPILNRTTNDHTVFDHLRSNCSKDWSDYINHPFVQKLADGTLPSDSFRHYLIQLYLFSKHYSRAYAMAVMKSEHLDDLREAAAHVDLILNYEMAVHVDYCAHWGITKDELEKRTEDNANRLYTRYVLDQGISGDLLDLLVALAPCSMGYAEIGARLVADPNVKLAGNPYRDWIEMNGGHEVQEGAASMCRFINRVAARRGVSLDTLESPRWESLIANFKTATQLEVQFWNMGLNSKSN